jgi:phospholipase/carboxylesterase
MNYPANTDLASEFIPARTPGSKRLMVVLHGLGDSLDSYRSFPAEIQLPWLNYLLVNAPTAYGPGYSWFDFPGDPTPGAEDSYQRLSVLLDQQRAAGFPTEETVLFGFSQGCLLVWETGMRYPHRFAGCIGVSGFMRDPHLLLADQSAVAKQQNFHITHGLFDPVIPMEPSQKQVETMRQAGIRAQWTEIIKGHAIDPYGEMLLLKRHLASLFA